MKADTASADGPQTPAPQGAGRRKRCPSARTYAGYVKQRKLVGCRSLGGWYHGPATSIIRKMTTTRSLEKHRGCVNAASYNQGGTALCSGSDDTFVHVWDVRADYKHATELMTPHAANIFATAFCPGDEDIIVTGGRDGLVCAMNVVTGTQNVLSRGRAPVMGTAFSSRHPMTVFSAHGGGKIKMLDLRQKGESNVLTGAPGFYTQDATMLEFNPLQPDIFVVGGPSPYAKFYDLRYLRAEDEERHFLQVSHKDIVKRYNHHKITGISGLKWHENGREIAVSYVGEAADVVVYDDLQTVGKKANGDRMMVDNCSEAGPFAKPASRPDEEDASPPAEKPAKATAATTASSSDEEEDEEDEELDEYARSSSHKDFEDTSASYLYPEEYREFRYPHRRNASTTSKQVCYFHDHQYIAAGTDDGMVVFWSRKTRRVVHRTRGDREIVNGVVPHPYLLNLVANGIDSSLRVLAPRGFATKEDCGDVYKFSQARQVFSFIFDETFPFVGLVPPRESDDEDSDDPNSDFI
ncbi:WD repeat protein iqw1 [Diplonema papillatum]|nr:WD repeat protein iqw1 [Diplonema papillatum]|eukprot:gene17555-27026_t